MIELIIKKWINDAENVRLIVHYHVDMVFNSFMWIFMRNSRKCVVYRDRRIDSTRHMP